MSSDFWSLLRSRGIDKPIVIGHSLGGTLGITLAEQHSNRLRAIIAVDGMPIFPGMEKLTPAQRDAAAEHFAAMLSAAQTPQQFEYAEKTYFPHWCHRPAISPPLRRSWPEATRRPPGHGQLRTSALHAVIERFLSGIRA